MEISEAPSCSCFNTLETHLPRNCFVHIPDDVTWVDSKRFSEFAKQFFTYETNLAAGEGVKKGIIDLQRLSLDHEFA